MSCKRVTRSNHFDFHYFISHRRCNIPRRWVKRSKSQAPKVLYYVYNKLHTPYWYYWHSESNKTKLSCSLINCWNTKLILILRHQLHTKTSMYFSYFRHRMLNLWCLIFARLTHFRVTLKLDVYKILEMNMVLY